MMLCRSQLKNEECLPQKLWIDDRYNIGGSEGYSRDINDRDIED